jgi:hypothetical protein
MLIDKRTLASKLSPFINEQRVIIDNQGVDDIISGMLNTHDRYKAEYDKIYKYFEGISVEATCRNIWNFLKQNVPYGIESENYQFLKSPASVLNTPSSDCKSFALFSAGCMSAYQRNTGKDIEVLFRYASYDPFDSTPEHTFCVVKEGNKEYWIDPVLNKFNQRKEPYSYINKKLKKDNMALIALAGINQKKIMGKGSGEGIDWSNIFDSLVKTAPNIITASRRGGGGIPPSGGYSPTGSGIPYTPPPPPAEEKGIDTNTILLIGGAAVVAFLLFKKK